MKSFLSIALLLALFGAPSWSQTQTGASAPASPAPIPSLGDVRESLNLARVALLWSKPIDWKEKGSSTTNIVARLRQVLGKDVAVEVRGKDRSLSTFELPQAPLGPTLSSIALLADAKLWVFPGRLLIAPEALLTPQENASIRAEKGGEWRQSTIALGGSWNPSGRFQSLAMTFMGAELKEHFLAKGLTPAPLSPPPAPIIPPRLAPLRAGGGTGTSVPTTGAVVFVPPPVLPLAYELPFAELSPASKEFLQGLMDVRQQQAKIYEAQLLANLFPPPPKVEPYTLDASTIVGYEDRKDNQFQLTIQKIDAKDPTKRTNISSWYTSRPRSAPSP